jgi:hypothetical protein
MDEYSLEPDGRGFEPVAFLKKLKIYGHNLFL